MAILNYTTSIDANKTIGEIQTKLSKAKAQAVMCEFGPNGVPTHVSFRVDTKHGIINFRLPANIEGVFASLRKADIPIKLKTREQATRVAWRICKDWLEAQLAIVEAEMVTMAEVFLPYAQGSDGKTLYQSFEESGMKSLTYQEEV